MASSFNSFRPTATIPLLLLLLLPVAYLPSPTLSQNGPYIAQCGPRLLPLAPCAPFVQGAAAMPTGSCCDNLRQVNEQQLGCLCLLLNNTAFSAIFPMNTTLAMQLPLICNIHFDMSHCSGPPTPSVSLSPTPQVSFGSTTNSTNAASPMVTFPKPRFMGFAAGHGKKLKSNGSLQLLMLVVLASVSSTLTSKLF